MRELLAADSRRVLKQRESELRRVDKRLVEIEADFDKNLDLLKRDVLNEEEFRRVNEARREERTQLEGRREELAAAVADQASRQEGVSALPVRIRSFLKDFGSLDVQRAKAMLQDPCSIAALIWRIAHSSCELPCELGRRHEPTVCETRDGRRVVVPVAVVVACVESQDARSSGDGASRFEVRDLLVET